MKKAHVLMVIGIGIMLFLGNCGKKARYEKMVSQGIESGERHDSLFLGLWLGMTSEEFYKQCWELNKQGLIRQGDGNTSVLYELDGEMKAVVDVNFYPTFFNDKVYEMPVKFSYKAWAPWNPQFSKDTLHVELVDLFEKWYGKGFMEVTHTDKGKAFVKIDGNRRISIYKNQNVDGIVWALYTDMSMQEEVKAAKDTISHTK